MVVRTDGRRAVEIGQRARHLQNPVAGTGRQRVALAGGPGADAERLSWAK
jgi:hypothetical protein